MIKVSNSREELDKSSIVCPSGLIVARIDDSSEEEGDEMSLDNKKKGLRELLADRAKG